VYFVFATDGILIGTAGITVTGINAASVAHWTLSIVIWTENALYLLDILRGSAEQREK